MKIKYILLLAGFIVVASFSLGWATPLLYIDPNPLGKVGVLPDDESHDVVETQNAEGWYGANLYALADVTLTYEFLGYEAAWTDWFKVDGEIAFENNTSSPGDQFYSTAAANSLLNFRFKIVSGPNENLRVINGSNVGPDLESAYENGYGAPNFFLGYADESMNSVYIALDDGGGGWSGNPLADDNHDDLVVKVTAAAVPEPASLILLGVGLAGLAGFNRKKLKKK